MRDGMPAGKGLSVSPTPGRIARTEALLLVVTPAGKTGAYFLVRIWFGSTPNATRFCLSHRLLILEE